MFVSIECLYNSGPRWSYVTTVFSISFHRKHIDYHVIVQDSLVETAALVIPLPGHFRLSR